VSRADDIAAGLARVHERIAAAERAAGRPAGSVRLVAVSKKMTVDDVRAALAAGQLDLGESYGQELRDKRQALADALVAPRWHFIGPLQANKVKYVAGNVALVHSIDSTALLDELERRALSLGPVPGSVQACLVQVNVSGEGQKRGVAPADLPALLDRFSDLAHVRCDGLMTVPPLADDPALARPHFAALRALRDREAARARPRVDLRELSMGMSHDLEVAVAEGATLVRVGTAIFGAR
jgi:pyridoxal phosphate enzyme (YggS family)